MKNTCMRYGRSTKKFCAPIWGSRKSNESLQLFSLLCTKTLKFGGGVYKKIWLHVYENFPLKVGGGYKYFFFQFLKLSIRKKLMLLVTCVFSHMPFQSPPFGVRFVTKLARKWFLFRMIIPDVNLQLHGNRITQEIEKKNIDMKQSRCQDSQDSQDVP